MTTNRPQKRETPRPLSFFVLAFTLSLFSGTALHADTTLIQDNFSTYTAGNLTGQGVWVADGAFTSPTVASATPLPPGGGDYITRNGTADSRAYGNYNLTFTGSETVDLSFEFYAAGTGTASGTTYFGLANTGSATTGPVFGYSGGFLINNVGWTTPTHAVDSSGNDITVAAGDWYEVTSVWNLSAGTATLSYQDLTDSGAVTPLYFNTAQTQTTASLGFSPSYTASSLNGVLVRIASQGNRIGDIDAVQLQSVPEPSTVALLALAAIGFGLAGWRKRFLSRI